MANLPLRMVQVWVVIFVLKTHRHTDKFFDTIHVTDGRDKPLVRLQVVRRLNVDKGQVLRSGILDTCYSIVTDK